MWDSDGNPVQAIEENLDRASEKLTPQAIGSNILNYLSGSMVPLIPVLMCADLFKTVGVILVPTMAGVVSETSDIYVLMNMLYNAAFSVYGIPCIPGNYTQSVIPILLSAWAMRYIERFFKKVIPDTLTTVFAPFLTMATAVPASLCLLAPLGSWLGGCLAGLFAFLGTSSGIIAIIGGGILAALWLPMVISGMHIALIIIAIANFMATGSDSFILAATTVSIWAACGC